MNSEQSNKLTILWFFRKVSKFRKDNMKNINENCDGTIELIHVIACCEYPFVNQNSVVTMETTLDSVSFSMQR